MALRSAAESRQVGLEQLGLARRQTADDGVRLLRDAGFPGEGEAIVTPLLTHGLEARQSGKVSRAGLKLCPPATSAKS